MKYLFIYTTICIRLFISAGYCQPLILTDPVSSKTFNSEKYSGIRGTPFLFDDWMIGSVETSKGIYKNLKLKLDIYNNILYFEKNQDAYEFSEEITAFTLTPNANDSTTYMYFKKGLSAGGLCANQFAQILSEGKINLYKSVIAMQTDLNQINEGTVKSFSKSIRYYSKRMNTVSLLKLNEKEIMEAINDQSTVVEKFINERHLSLKKEQDVQKIFKYYNSL